MNKKQVKTRIRISPTLLHIRLLGCSYWRIFGNFPFIFKLLFVVILVVFISLLAKVKLEPTLLTYTTSILSFAILGRWISRITPTELVLIKNLRVSIAVVTTLKCLLLATLFLILDWLVGVLAITVGTAAVVTWMHFTTKNGGKLINFQSKSFSFKKPFSTAYQWIACWRSEIGWIELCICILFTIALGVNNLNMACVMAGSSICIPAFAAYYNRKDPTCFLRIYKNTQWLMWRKLYETLLFSSIPFVFYFIAVCCVFPSKIGLFIWVFPVFMYVNILIMYTLYTFYPHVLIAFVMSGILLILSSILLTIFPTCAIVLFPLILVFLHYLSIQNLKTIHSNYA